MFVSVPRLTCQGLDAGALKELGAGTLCLPEPRADWAVVVVELALGFHVVQVWGGISHRAQNPETRKQMQVRNKNINKYMQKHDYVH